jgi:hypothetical protein
MIDQFDILVNEILKKDLNVGDKVKNINPDCEHYGSEGVVKKLTRRPEEKSGDVKNNHNIPGSDAEYEVTNDTTNASTGDKLKKSLDQLKIKSKT